MSKKATVKTEVPAFDAYASRVMKAQAAFDAASEKFAITLAGEFQAYIDSCEGLPKDEQTTKALGNAMRNAQPFIDACAIGTLETKTRTEYVQSAMRAFYWGVPFAQSLKNNPDFALPWGGAKSSKPGKSGGVQSTTREALDETLCKALTQARLLGLTEFAAEVLDLCLDRLDGFAEPTEQ